MKESKTVFVTNSPHPIRIPDAVAVTTDLTGHLLKMLHFGSSWPYPLVPGDHAQQALLRATTDALLLLRNALTAAEAGKNIEEVEVARRQVKFPPPC